MRTTTSVLAAAIASTWSVPARAGNDDGILLGNDAALTGGAVTAVVQDGSALWYNPAGIGGVARDSVDLSASAFVLRAYSVPGLMAYSTGERADGDLLEIVSVPSALTLVRRLGGRARLALGVFVPQASDVVLRSKLDVQAEPADASWVLTAAESASVYHLGAGVGGAVGPDLWLGASLFGVYRASFGSAQFWGGFARSGETLAFLGSTSVDSRKSLGVEAGVGAQWRPSGRWHVGLSLRSPGLQLLEAARTTTLTGAASVAEDGTPLQDFTTDDDDELRARAGLVSPLRVRLGVAYGGPAGWLSAEGDVQSALDDLVRRETTWNARIGGRIQLSRRVGVGLGLFTDRSPEPTVRDFGAARLDFYGATAGLELSTAHPLERRSESARDLVFSTTVAVRYAIGIGEVGGIRFDPDAPPDEVISTPAIDATVHEASLHLGSALYF